MSRPIEREFQELKTLLRELSTRVEEGFHFATQAFITGSVQDIEQVLQGEPVIDQLDLRLEELCIETIARHQPVSKDLRFLVSLLKVTSDLERVGDLAKNIAKRARELAYVEKTQAGLELGSMVRKVGIMLGQSIDALMTKDVDRARGVIELDREVDALHQSNFGQCEALMQSQPQDVPRLMRHMSISRHLERIGDLSTNIAEEVIFINEGHSVRHKKVRGVSPNEIHDTTSSEGSADKSL